MSYDRPDFVMLWQKKHYARNPFTCCRCGDRVERSQPYESVGYRLDGVFHHDRMHYGADSTYAMSGCPKYAEQDRAELAAQFECDRREMFPRERA